MMNVWDLGCVLLVKENFDMTETCPCCERNVIDGHSWLCDDCKLHRDSCHTEDTIDTMDTKDTIIDKFWNWYDKHIIK